MMFLLKEHFDVSIPKSSRDGTCILDTLWPSVIHQGRNSMSMPLECTSGCIEQGQLTLLGFQPI